MDERSEGRALRVGFAGTPEFAVASLEALLESRHDVVGVVTNPDRPRGRNREPAPPPVKRAVSDWEIPVFQPEEVGSAEAIETLRRWDLDVFVVVAYGAILPKEVLDLPEYGCINVHASLLPKYRGAAPINWAIVRGEEETGVTIMKMDAGMDTGPILLRESVEIGELETAQQLHDRLAELGADLVVRVVDRIAEGEIEATPQEDEEATYAPKLSKSDGAIDWRKSAEEVANHIRGFNPWPGAYSDLERAGSTDSARIKFHLAEPVDKAEFDEKTKPGEVLVADPSAGELVVACGSGAIRCLEIQAPGRKKMESGDFLNGFDIEAGDRFQ